MRFLLNIEREFDAVDTTEKFVSAGLYLIHNKTILNCFHM